MIGKGGLLTQMSGHRKGTARFCNACRQWVGTPRGLAPGHGHVESCPDLPVESITWESPEAMQAWLDQHPEVPRPSPWAPITIRRLPLFDGQPPAFIPAARLGSKRRSRGVGTRGFLA